MARFNDRLYSVDSQAIWLDAQATANVNGAPVVVLTRDGWLAICEQPTDDMDPDPITEGWREVALVDPQESE